MSIDLFNESDEIDIHIVNDCNDYDNILLSIDQIISYVYDTEKLYASELKKELKKCLVSDIKRYKSTIKNMKHDLDKMESYLSKLDEMDMPELEKTYNQLINNAI